MAPATLNRAGEGCGSAVLERERARTWGLHLLLALSQVRLRSPERESSGARLPSTQSSRQAPVCSPPSPRWCPRGTHPSLGFCESVKTVAASPTQGQLSSGGRSGANSQPEFNERPLRCPCVVPVRGTGLPGRRSSGEPVPRSEGRGWAAARPRPLALGEAEACFKW